MFDELPTESRGWRRPTWLLLLVVASVTFSLGFACATPFVAFAAIAAGTLPRRDAYLVALGVWLANQVVGFGFLHYPWTSDCLAWGGALGVTTLLATAAARLAVRSLDAAWPVARGALSFLAAYAAYEVALLGFSLWLGGIEHHTLAIQGRVFAVQMVAMIGLLVLDRIGVTIGIAPASGRSRPLTTRPA